MQPSRPMPTLALSKALVSNPTHTCRSACIDTGRKPFYQLSPCFRHKAELDFIEKQTILNGSREVPP